MIELWSNKGMPDGYTVSNLGSVKDKRGNIMKQKNKNLSDPRSYSIIYLTVSYKKQKAFKVHRLVGSAFLINSKNLPCINHIDGNKVNNSISNLEWVSFSENMQHAYDIGLKKRTIGRSVIATNITTLEKIKFDSCWEAARKLNVQQPNVFSCCAGKRKYHKGFTFSFC
jgi:hypothetical protein